MYRNTKRIIPSNNFTSLYLLGLALASLLVSGSANAATPGIPFEEDFADTALQDVSQTNANWNTDEETLLIADWKRRFGTFGPATSSITFSGSSHSTSSLAIGDVNGDGKLDYIEGNQSAGIFGVNKLYLGTGDLATGGSDPFGLFINISGDSQTTSSLALGDVNGDGHLDLVAGNNGQQNTQYLNNGASADPFAGVLGMSITSTFLNTQGIALSDVNNDGRLDLIAGNSGQANVLHLNNGTANPFTGLGTPITTGTSSTMAIVLADVNNDGYNDLVTGNLGQANRLYLNNAGANVDPFSGVVGLNITADNQNTHGITLADVNGDGDIDLIVGNDLAHNKLYLNSGAGVFAAGTNISDDQFPTRGVLLNDVDNDGDLDLIAATFHVPGGSVQRNKLYLNNGSASPYSATGTGIDISTDEIKTSSLAMGDLNGDGQPDLITSEFSQNRVYLSNNSESPFALDGSGFSIPTSQDSYAVTLGDINQDGYVDLISGNYGQANTLYLNNGTSSPFAGVAGTTFSGVQNTEALAVGDMDGDGDLDVVAGNDSQTNTIYINTAGVLNAGTAISADTNRTYAIAVGDVDEDGDLDIVTGNFSTGVNRLYRNNGSGTFVGSDIDNAATEGNTRSIALADADGDGDLDIIVGNGNHTNDRHRFIPNVGGNFTSGMDISSASAVKGYDIAMGDVNLDGKLDLVLGSTLYLNNGGANPYFGVGGISISGGYDSSDTSFELADFDKDGDLDLIAGLDGPTNKLFINDGGVAPFSGVTGINISSDFGPTKDIAVADLDNDGDLDLIAGEDYSSNKVYMNNGTSDVFSPVLTSSTISDPSTNAVAYGDIDGDGDLDLVTGRGFTGTGNNDIHTNNGDGSYTKTALTTGTAFVTRAIELVDIDNDGNLDIVTGDDGPNSSNLGATNKIYFNLGGNPATFSAASNITLDSHKTQSIALGDVNNDGHIDFISGNEKKVSGEDRYLYLNNGSSTPFSAVSGMGIQPTRTEITTHAMALGDIDNDGDLDLITGSNNGPVQLHLNDGDNTPFSDSTELQITGSNHTVYALDLGDVDNDGNLDLVLGSGTETNKLFLNSGSGANPFFGVAGQDISADDDLTDAIKLGDIDNDGDLDVIAGNFNAPNKFYLNSGGVIPFASTGSGTAFPGVNSSTYTLALADLDSDGDLDVVSAEGLYSRLFLNQTIRYNLNFNKARSVEVDTDTGNIDSAILRETLALPLPANSSVNYYLSNDGGMRWFKTKPEQALVFPTSGTDLRWRAELASGSPVLSPQVETIEIITPSLQLAISKAQMSENGDFSSATVTRNSTSHLPLEVTLASNDTTEATVPATVTIPAGQSSVNFNVISVQDNFVDNVVTVQITATAAGYNNTSDSIGVTDDDVPELTLVISPSTAVEGYSSGSVTGVVTRNTDTLSSLTVNLSSNDTSEITVSASVEIAAGQSSSDLFTVEVVDDIITDYTQNVTVSASASGFTNGVDTIDVQDNDFNLTLNFQAPSILETSGAMATTATVTRSTETSMPLTVILASDDESEVTVPASIIIAASQSTSPAFPVNAVDDAIADGTQTVTIRAIEAGHNQGINTIDILDNEVAILTVTIFSASISESDAIQAVGGQVVRNSELSIPLTVTLSSSDSSEAVVPISVTFTPGFNSVGFSLEAIDDLIADGTQTVTITASAVGHTNGSDTVDILDDDGFLELNISDSSIGENSGPGATTATVTRVGDSHTSPLEVTLFSNKTLEATVQANVTIAAGQSTSAAFPINAIDEELVDGTQTVTLMASATGFVNGTDSLDVTDDDVPTLSVVITPDEVFEFAGEGIVRVTRNTDTSADLIVTLTSDDTAQATVVASITIPAGETNHFGRAQTVRDFIPDGTQTVTITASTAGFVSGSDTLDILDEDALLRVDFLAPSIVENAGLAATTATVTRVGGIHTLPLVVTLSSNDTTEATVQTDITIAAGQSTSPAFPINAVDDALIDATRIATIQATAADHASGSADLDVTDDENPVLTLTVFVSNIPENDFPFTLRLDRNSETDVPLVVTLTSSDTSEVTVPASATVFITQATKYFNLRTVDDMLVDGTQTVTLTASAAGYATGMVTFDVIDDDDDDGDGVENSVDNCPDDANSDQINSDTDALGDECDDDDDNDSILDIFPDNCRTVPNLDQLDSDMNGVGDACEDGLCFPIKVSNTQVAVICL
jgi:hypothetical protein